MKIRTRHRVARGGGANALSKSIRELSGNHKVKVGFPSNSKPYPDTGTSVIKVALWNEMGTRKRDGRVHIPARPFLRPAIRENRNKYIAMNRTNLPLVLHGKLTTHQALSQLGAVAVGDVQKKIVAIKEPPKSDATMRGYEREGHGDKTNPLIKTGHMRQSVTHEVVIPKVASIGRAA